MCCEETQHPAPMEASRGCAETASRASPLAARRSGDVMSL
jgi:hypothetical protein